MKTCYKLYAKFPFIVKRIIIKIVRKTEKEWCSERLRYLWELTYGVKVGMGSYGCFQNGAFSSGDIIGNYCSIAGNVWHLNANHPMTYACMSPLFYSSAFSENVKDVPRQTLEIGHDVWIGRDVKILSNVKRIGNGAVLGAGCVVTKDVEPYAIVGGVPAKVIRYRFDSKTIAVLEGSKWWELSPEQLLTLYDVVDQPIVFAEKAKEMS